jgi:hypothetical protein
MYRKSVTAAARAGANPPPVSRDPVPPVERAERDVPPATSALDFCRDVLLSVSKLTQGQPSLASVQQEINSILQKLEVHGYKSVLEVKDDVLATWRKHKRWLALESLSPFRKRSDFSLWRLILIKRLILSGRVLSSGPLGDHQKTIKR